MLRAASIEPEFPPSAAAALIKRADHLSDGQRRRRVAISAETVNLMERRPELHVFLYLGDQDVQLVQALKLLAVLRRG